MPGAAIAFLAVASKHTAGRDAYDWLMLAVAAVAALATTSAVLVALFGPPWRERRRRPLLALDATPDWDGVFAGGGDTVDDGYHLVISNSPGKSTAHGVEVRIDVFSFLDELAQEDGSPLPTPLIEDRRLNFLGNDGSYGASTATVQPGSSRRVYLMRTGHPQTIFDSWQPIKGAELPNADLEKFCGAWATVPARQDEMHWVLDGEYELVITLMGDNFDAVCFAGRLRLDHYVIPAADMASKVSFNGVGLKWIRPLQETPFSKSLSA